MIELIILLLSVVYPFQCVDALPELHHIEARNTWAGYEYGGWVVPSDIEREYTTEKDDEYDLIVMYSQTTNMYYLFVFDDIFDIDNIHPCGYGAINRQQYLEVRQWAK